MKNILKNALFAGAITAGITGTTLLATKPAAAQYSNYPIPIHFQPGATSTTIFSRPTYDNTVNAYVLNAYAGQTMSVKVDSRYFPHPILSIYSNKSGVLIGTVSDSDTWTGRLPSTGQYYIDVVSQSGAFIPSYYLKVAIR